jgi:uncharacterized metal-binding protein
MADGKTHAVATRTLAMFLFIGQIANGIYRDYPLQTIFFSSLALSAGALAGLFLTPDLDVDVGSDSEQEVRDISPFGENLWWIYWYPYRKLIPHRSPLSHWPVIGTIGRLLYLNILYGIALTAARFLNETAFHWLVSAGVWLLNSSYFYIFAVGLAGADTLHFFMDQRVFHKIFRQRRWIPQQQTWWSKAFARNQG